MDRIEKYVIRYHRSIRARRTQTVCVKMPVTMVQEIDRVARIMGKDRSKLIREAVERFLRSIVFIEFEGDHQ